MADKPEDPQLKTVNKSGYPLQIALADAIKGSKGSHGWRVLYEEHAWSGHGNDGFIDVVLEHEDLQVVLLLECKRLLSLEWIFLTPSTDSQPRRHVRALRVERNSSGGTKPGFPRWSDEPCDPHTWEAAFYVARGEERGLTIEKIGAELVEATEALEREEALMYLDKRGGVSRRLYMCAIVTTAQLSSCRFDPASVSLTDGMIPNGAEFKKQHVVRYTKQLSTRALTELADADRIFGQEASAVIKAKERTLFVINAEHLLDFLAAFSVDDRRRNGFR